VDTYEALEVRDAGDLVVGEFKRGDVLVSNQVLKVAGLNLVVTEFDLKQEHPS